MNVEKRFTELQAKQGKISGYAVKWGIPSYVSSIGRIEKFARGSLKFPKSGVPLYFQHDKKNLLANSVSKTLLLKEDDIGLFFEAQLPKNATLVRELCERKDIQGASVGFVSEKENYNGGVREIEKCILRELSLVSAPAHNTGGVSYRSADVNKKHWSNLLWVY